MKFHVGDYVRLADGLTGWLSSVKPSIDGYELTITWDDGKTFSWSGGIQELPGNIVRIGQYAFNSKEGER